MSTSWVKKLVCLVAVALSSGTSGCQVVLGNVGQKSELTSHRVASYEGKECEEVLYALGLHGDFDYNHDERKFPQQVDESPRAQILLASCARRQKRGTYGHDIVQWPKIKDLDIGKTYEGLDDRRLDHVLVAASVIRVMDDEYQQHGIYKGKKWIGLVRFYSEILDRSRLATKVGKAGVPDEAGKAFLALYDDAVSRARDAGLDVAEKALYVDAGVATYKARKEHYKKFASFYSDLDELSASAKDSRSDEKVADRLIEKISTLRANFLNECGKPECRSLPAWVNATRELALLHVARGNVLDAMAESIVHMREGTYTAGFAQAIRAAQEQLGQEMREANRKYKKAKSSGVDEKQALQLAGGTQGFDYDDSMLFHPKMSLPNYAAALDDKAASNPRDVEVPVASVSPNGSRSRVTFEKDTYKSDEAYNCQTTNKVTRIRSDGTLEYEEICQYRPTQRSVDKHDPVNIPAAEAKGLRARDVVRFIAKGEEARVIEVKRDGKVVQVRGDVLAASATPKK